jgi:hypothetical protein
MLYLEKSMTRRAPIRTFAFAIVTTVLLLPNHSIGQVTNQRWVQIGSTNNDVYFVDLSSMRQRQNRATGWLLTYHAQPEIVRGTQAVYRVERYEANCDDDTVGLRSEIRYNGSGEVLDNHEVRSVDLTSAAPGTFGEKVMVTICGRDQSVSGPTEAQVIQRLNLRRLRNPDGTALLPNGAWAVSTRLAKSSDFQFYQVANRMWTPRPSPDLSDAAVSPPIGLYSSSKSFREIQLTLSGWVYTNAERRPVPDREIDVNGGAWTVVDGVKRYYLIQGGKYFNRIRPSENGFVEGEIEEFRDFVGIFRDGRFVPMSKSFTSISDALNSATRTMSRPQ